MFGSESHDIIIVLWLQYYYSNITPPLDCIFHKTFILTLNTSTLWTLGTCWHRYPDDYLIMIGITGKSSQLRMKPIEKHWLLWLSISFNIFVSSRCIDAHPGDRPPQRRQSLRQWQLCPKRGALRADRLLCCLLHPAGHHGGDVLPHHTGSPACVCLQNVFLKSFCLLYLVTLCCLAAPPGAPETGHCLLVRGQDFLPAAFAHTSKYTTASILYLPPSSDQHTFLVRPTR